MHPFIVSESAKRLVGQYPRPEEVSQTASTISNMEKGWFIRLWLSEGIPFAFRNAPMVYEALRNWLARELDVHPKEITVIGSARIGYSLAPQPQFGRVFGEHSDLDLSVISRRLFARLSDTFWQWKGDFERGSIRPKTPHQHKMWTENIKRLPSNINRGFIDPYKIPNYYKYCCVQSVSQTIYLLKEKLILTPSVPNMRKASVRVYRDWDAFIAQMTLNLSHALRSLRKHRDSA